MAISFSRPDPSSPAAVADAAFGTARRGFDQQEVRDFLRMVAAELARLQERERFLERELRAAQANTLPPDGMDDDMATRLLGEEAARILQTAREGAVAIRTKAEDGAGRLLREAADEAQRVREETDLEASRRRSDASADAEAELATAKQQGREMVEEAKAYRERVLSELSRRRELARQQIEQLLHGRDRLLQAFERARIAAVDVVAEITPLGEPADDIDLSPTTGPVPIITAPTADIADASSIDDIALTAITDEAEAVELEDEVEAAVLFDGRLDEDHDEENAPATVLAFPAAPEPTEDEIDDDDVTATDIDDLFARLRSGGPEDVEEELGVAADELGDDGRAELAEPGEAVDETETPFRHRDAVLVPLIVTSARKLKRVLADEQNEVLDVLRNKEPVTDLGGLLVASDGQDGQADRYVEAATGEIIAAIEAGAASVGRPAFVDRGPAGPVASVRVQMTSELITPLRDRLERSVVDGDGDNEAVARRARGVYREWKTQRIDEHLDDLFRLAHCQGVVAAVPAGGRATWEVDPDGPPSPDCEDNALAGPVTIGEAFPSGHLSPPMHPGCRCLLSPVGE